MVKFYPVYQEKRNLLNFVCLLKNNKLVLSLFSTRSILDKLLLSIVRHLSYITFRSKLTQLDTKQFNKTFGGYTLLNIFKHCKI